MGLRPPAPAWGSHHGGTPIRKRWMREDEEDEGEEVSQFEAYRERSETEVVFFFSFVVFVTAY